MSRVTSIILVFSVLEQYHEEATPSGCVDRYAVIDEINAWLEARSCGVLADMGDAAGGNKNLPLNVWGGAFNYLDLEGFTSQVISRSWEEPEQVVLIWDDEEDEEDEGVTVKRVTELRAERARSA